MNEIPPDGAPGPEAGSPPEAGEDLGLDATDQTLPLLRVSGAGPEETAPRPPRGGSPAVFARGEVIAGRFRIVRFLAQGGMGQVFEAEDLELQEPVALKTVRTEAAGDERALQRFRREIHLARKVTHPNVCRTFDVFRHAAGPGEPPVLFLTMELLAGETLAERLRRQGRMATEEALPLVRQMAEGLAAAHRAGVVHRDFNPKNVMLVPGPEGTRAVITDFGLAHPHAGSGDVRQAAVTGPGVAAGTPAYMAPEQIEGLPATAATDLYSLGVVVYEMVTGEWPFVGDSPLSTAVKRLKEAPPSPRLHAPDLDPRWEAAILRCLEREPEARFASALDLTRALEGTAPPVGSSTAAELLRAAPRSRRRLLAGVAGVALLLALAAGGAFLASRSQRPEAASRPAVAVLGFKNLSGRPGAAWLSTAFAEMLSTELAAGQALRTVPEETVARARTELALPEAQSLGAESLDRLRRVLATDYVVAGSYSALGAAGAGQVRLDLRLQDAATGETMAAIAEQGTEERLFDLVARAGARLRGRLGVAAPSPTEREGARAAVASSPEAARAYAEGLAALYAFDHLRARDLLERAVAAEPGYPLAHAALSRAWAALGYDARAAAEAKLAFDTAEGLPREERLLIEGQLREVTGAWPRAVEVYRTLWGFFPDHLEYGLRLARAQTGAGRAREALATVRDLSALPAPSSLDPRIDLAEADAAGRLSDHRRALAAARRAHARGEALGERLLAAQALSLEGIALRNLARRGEAEAALRRAAGIYREVGDRAGVAGALRSLAVARVDAGELAPALQLYRDSLAIQREVGNRSGAAAALNNIGIVLRRQGDLEGAARAHEEALVAFRELGDRASESKTLNSLANVLSDQGDLARARRTYERALSIKRATGDAGGVVSVLDNIAEILTEEGRLAEAQKLIEEALAYDRRSGDRSGVANDLTSLGEVLYLAGDLPGAQARHREALAVARAIGEPSLAAWARFGLGNVALAAGDLGAARGHHQAALAARTALGEAGSSAESRLALGAVALAAGRPAEAEALARRAAREFAGERRLAQEAAARCLLARAALALGDAERAARELGPAAALAARSQNLGARLGVAIAEGETAAAQGRLDPARVGLEEARREAEAAGLVALGLEARLALARAELAAGGLERAARERAAAVGESARRRGFGLLAGQAAALARSGPVRAAS